MALSISKNISTEDLANIFGGNIPIKDHPLSYINTRLQEEHIFLARMDNQPAGFLIYDIWWGNCPFIELLKVNETYQRKGIGKELLSAAIKEIKSKNFTKLISSSEVVNDMGLSFHKSFGFSPLKTLDLPHGEEQFFSIDL